MEFAKPAFHVGTLVYCKNTLTCVCLKCSQPLIYKYEKEVIDLLKTKKPKQRFAALRKLCKNVTHCQGPKGCGTPVPKITIPKKNSGTIELVAEYRNKAIDDSGNYDPKKKILSVITPERASRVLSLISDENAFLMGFDPIKRNRPEDLVITRLPFPPNQIRPSARMDLSSHSTLEDQLTHKLADMVKANNKERKRKGGDNTVPEDGKPNLIQYHYATYIDNESMTMPRSEQKGTATKSLRSRLKSKSGRVRHNLMGKRVDFSARSVITGDPNIGMEEVGVPMKIALTITVPETVTKDNLAAMKKLCSNGKDKYPGAKFITPMVNGVPGRKIFLKGLKREVPVNIGDVVERHLRSGDYVLFNRQPSLHRLSMMAHKARIIHGPWATFRMNVSDTTPYNADFDGDEMNIFVPQCEQTAIELEYRANVSRQIITPGSSKPIIGCVQDTLLAGYMMTDEKTKIDGRTAINLMMNTGVGYANLRKMDKNKTYSGRELYSMVIPDKISVTYKNCKVKRGKMVSGQLSKDNIGNARNSLVHNVWDEYRHTRTYEFINNSQRLIGKWLERNGFSVGMKDLELPKKVRQEIHNLLESKKLETNHLITETESNTVLQDVNLLEDVIKAELDVTRDNISKNIVANLPPDNAFYVMLTSGSKGSALNMGQMTGCVGQQNVEGKRIEKRINGRTMVHFHQNDDSASARGFVENNYVTGLTPAEFFFHLMAGREGLIDTAIKTAETGYVQRRLIKSLEDLMIEYDRSVRNSNGTMIQPLYGGSGFDPCSQVDQKVLMITLDNNSVRDRYTFVGDENPEKYGTTKKENVAYYQKLLELRDEMRRIQMRLTRSYIVLNDVFKSPVNFSRIIEKYMDMADDYTEETPLDARYAMNTLDKLLSHEYTPLLAISKRDQKDSRCMKMKDEEMFRTQLTLIYHEYLAPKRCILEYGFGKERFDLLINEVYKRYRQAMAAAGDMVGIVAGQSIGEPATQMCCLSSTPICVLEIINHKEMKMHKKTIGEFCDRVIDANPDRTADIGKGSIETDLVAHDRRYFVPSVSRNEGVTWSEISHISRHHANGGMVRVKTMSGREITCTLSHSFLKRGESTVDPVKGSELKLGDRIPVVRNLEHPTYETGKILMERTTGGFTMKMDRISGWFVGAYLADGNVVSNSVRISKVSQEYRDMLKKFADQYGIKTSLYESYGEYGPSKDTRFNSKELATFIMETIGTGSFDKIVPAFSFLAHHDFIRGMIQGYFDGDGNVNVPKHMIRNGSVNKNMIRDMGLFLSYAGVFASLCEEKISGTGGPFHTLQIPYKYARNFKRKIGSCYAKRLEELDQIIAYAEADDRKTDQEYIDQIPNLGNTIYRVAKALKMEGLSRNYKRWIKKEAIGRKTLEKYIKLFQNTAKEKNMEESVFADMKLLEQAANSHVVWDKIIELEVLPDPKEWVYDFTVPDNQTFMTGDGTLVHNTLNTFHHTGISEKSGGMMGVPRLKELLSFAKNPKTPKMSIYLDEALQTNKAVAHKISSFIKFTTLSDVVSHLEIYYDPIPTTKGGVMERDGVDNVFYSTGTGKAGCQSDIVGMPWVLRFVLNREQMLDKEVSLLDIKSKFCSWWAARHAEMKTMKKEEKAIMEKITRCSILSNYNNSDTPVVHIRFDMSVLDFTSIVSFGDVILSRFKLKGVPGITAVHGATEEKYIRFDEKTGAVVRDERYVIYADGINMVDIRYLNGVDPYKTISNNVVEIYMSLGIEAARAALLREFKTVLEGSGGQAAYQHLSILVDMMMNTGDLVSIDRHGMNRLDSDPLARASFEKTVEQIIASAFYGEKDKMRSVSSRIMAGQAFNGGTALPKVYMDLDAISRTEYVPSSTRAAGYNALTENKVIDDVLNKSNHEMFIPE
jgi:DNA-directed RNA polymerase beta' subunit